MNQYDMLEPLVDLRVLDHAHEGRGARPGAQQIEPLSRLQIVQDQRSGRLAADQEPIAFADVLQPGGERPVRHLDAQELEVLLVIGAGNAIRAQQRSAIDVEADHEELAVLETQTGIAGGGEGELCVGPVVYLEYLLSANRRQDRLAEVEFGSGMLPKWVRLTTFFGPWPNSPAL